MVEIKVDAGKVVVVDGMVADALVVGVVLSNVSDVNVLLIVDDCRMELAVVTANGVILDGELFISDAGDTITVDENCSNVAVGTVVIVGFTVEPANVVGTVPADGEVISVALVVSIDDDDIAVEVVVSVAVVVEEEVVASDVIGAVNASVFVAEDVVVVEVAEVVVGVAEVVVVDAVVEV